jgi:glutamine phosphoribosylpyrophosphate amidotransferase
VGLGQVRYPTAGNAYSEEEAQPFYVNAPYGIVLVHNGNLTNAQALKAELFDGRPPPHQHRERHRGADQRAGARTGTGGA